MTDPWDLPTMFTFNLVDFSMVNGGSIYHSHGSVMGCEARPVVTRRGLSTVDPCKILHVASQLSTRLGGLVRVGGEGSMEVNQPHPGPRPNPRKKAF